MSNMCLVVTPAIEELASKIQQEYPEACQRNGFNNQMCAEWIGLYNNTNSKNPDNVPAMKSLVNFIEKLRNQEGKSFLRDLEAEKEQYAIEQEMREIKAVYNQLKAQYAPNSSEAKLTDIVFQALRNTEVVFRAADLGEGISGKYVASENTILYNPNSLQSNTLLHEAIHAVTSYYLGAENTQGFSKEVKTAIKEIEECYELLKQDFIEEWKKKGVEVNASNYSLWIEGNDTYGLTNPKELVAELGKPEFVERIKDFDRRHKGQNIFQRLKDAIFTLFGINKNYGSLESTLKKALITLLTNPNKELQQRYSQENTNVKKNHKALTDSKHIIVNNEGAIKEMLKNLSKDASEEYVDTALILDEESIPYSFVQPEGANATRISALKDGSIFVYRNMLFMSLNGTPKLENGKAIIPVRVYSKKDLALNKFDIQRNSDGIDYIKTTTALFPEVQSIIQQPSQQQNVPASYEGLITPDANTIFVFGSNPEGRHGAGAAKTAREKFGAIYGQGEGLQGNAYALPTKDLRVKENRSLMSISPAQITENIKKMYEVARQNPSKQFKVAYTNGLNEATLNGYTGAEMIKMFKDAGPIPSNVIFSKNWTNHWNEVQSEQQPVQQQSLPGPETKINIYAGTGENADLSNFAYRPFDFREGYEDENSEAYRYFMELHPFLPEKFDSVEQAFQAFKWAHALISTDYAGEYLGLNTDERKDSESYKYGEKISNQLGKILDAKTSAKAKRLGGQRGILNNNDVIWWDNHSSDVMKFLLKQSFKQNPQALQRLLATGNATLTHTQDRGKWGTEFPKLLMEVRDELKGNTQQPSSISSPSQAAQNTSQPNTRPQSDSFKTALKVTENRTTQFYQTFTPQQIKDRGVMISDYFSDIIDDYILDELDRVNEIIENPESSDKDKEEARTLKNLLRDPINGRQYAANKIQIGNILNEVKNKIRRKVNSYDGVEKQLWQNTLDFFDELFNNQASLEIEEQEGIRIIGLKTIEKSPDDIATEEENDGDDETGHTVSGNDGWLFQTRFENPASSLSKRVRRMTYNIRRSASDKDDLGHTRKYPSGQIYATLLSYLAKTMQNPDDFMQVIRPEEYDGIYDHYGNEVTDELYPYGYPTFPVLETMRSQYPWVEQIINRLTDDYLDKDWNTCIAFPSTYGAMASQFYTNFRKVFIPYAKIQVGDGKFGVTPLNTEMEARCQKDKLAANFNNGIVMTDTCIYNTDTTINREHAEDLKDYIHDVIDDGGVEHAYRLYQDLSDPDSDTTKIDPEEFNKFLDRTVFLLNSFGISSNRENVVALLAQTKDGGTLYDMLKDLIYIADTISKVSDENAKNFNYLLDLHYVGGESVWGKFFDGRGMITDESYMQSFYDSASKKTRYSYSADNYLQKTFRGLYNPNLEERRAFIDARYKKYEWFYNHKTNTWRNKWLEHLYNAQDISDVLPYRNINNITEYGETTKVRDYSKWNPSDVWLVQNRSFDGTKPYTFYLAPIFSDSPMSMTVMGPVLNNIEVLDALVGLVDQEMWRMKYVGEREAAIERGEIKPIANYDGKRGKEFCFIPELNDFTFENGETFLQAITRMKEGRAEDGSSAVYTKEDIENVEKQAIMTIMSQKADDYLAENRDQYDFENFDFNEFLGNYMNMVYANTSIIQLTTIDLAFHKDATEFQKRFKEVYAGGIQMNTNSRYGKKTENVVLLADDIITSPSYDSIAEIINNNSHLTDKEKERILNTFTDINVADAQAIRSMHSFRSVMDMMGRWDEMAQEALEHFEKGEWDKEDFEVVYQTIKPFVYAVIDRNDGFGGVIPVPQQHKNSEICALMMYSLITNNLDSPVYRALSRFMETKDSNGEYLVDMIQFESAGKVGNQGVVNINYNPNKVMAALENEEYDFIPEASNTLENVDTNYKAIKKQMDKRLIDKKISQEDYNKVMQSLRPTEDEIVDMLNQSVLINNADGSKGINPEVVHTIPFDNYYQAQPTPEHHIDAEATFGSQGRNIAPADLPDNFELTLKVKGKNKTITLKGRDKVIDFYYELLDEDLIEDFFGDGKNKGGLKEVFASKENLMKAVTDIVRGNPKYGKDFVEALKLDSDGNFTISPNSPTMFTLMQELVTSLFKNRITKQKINGAALIQAAGIGLDEKLRLVKDAKGNIVGAQCLMPLTSREFFEPFIEERAINSRKEMVLNPEKLAEAGLDKAVGYRIPTENKSSMLPLIITGFTPLQNGSTIILPAEITALAGSDFDVDKMFVMLSEFYIQKYDMKAAREAWANENYVTTDVFSNSDLEENLSDEDPEEFKEWFKKNKEKFRHKKPQVKRVEYDWSKSPKENGRKARNNMIIQMIYGILTSGAGNQSLLNPQGFDNAKAAAKLHRIISDPTLRQQLFKNYASGITATVPSAGQIRTMFLDAYKDMDPTTLASLRQSVNAMSDEDVVNAYIEKVALENDDIIDVLLNSSLKDREKFIKEYSAPESPIYPQTFAHSHAKNMAGSNQIGIYAIQGSMAAKYQRANITLKPNQQFVVNGRTLKDVDVSENSKRLKNVGEMIGASADNGKDPILSDAGSTTKTAPIIGYMLRLGLTHEEAVLIINQPFMKDVNYNPDRVDRAVKKMPVGDVSTKTLVKSILNPYSLTPIEQMNIIAMCYRILEQAKAMEGLTMISRADSPNGAMQNTFAKARVQQYMVERFNAEMNQRGFPFYPIKEVINNNTVKVSEGEDAVREKLKAQPMAFLHAMYGLGINSLNDLASPYFFMLKKEFDDAIVKPILYNQNVTNKEHLENLVDDLYLEYITYALSVSPLFGEEQNADGTQVSMKSKRDYYLNSFADDFAKTLQENSAIREQLGSILQRDGNRVVLKDVGSLAKGQKDAISRRFDALMALGEEGQKLAKDLLLYAYYDSGLNFGHSSYSTRLSTYFLSQFPAFREILQQLDTPLTEEQQKNFIHQFLITHKDAAYSVDNIINRETNVDEDTISVDMNDFKMNRKFVNTILSPDPRMTGVQPYPYISFDNYVYELDADAYDMNPSVAVYHKLEDYPTGDYRPIYNANKSLSQLAEEYNQTEPQQRPEEPSIDIDSNPDIAHNTGNENPDIDNSSDDNDEWGSISMNDVDDVESPGPASKSENYDIEGKSNLESPFC